MELRQLEAFMAVAAELHFGRAAERLHIAPPTLSELIRRLERELGTPLFTRTTRQVAITNAGSELRMRSKVILDEVAAAKAAVRRVAGGEAGTVRLGITPPVAPVLAPHLIRLFAAEAPQVTVELQRMWLPKLLGAVAAGDIDVALTCGPVPEQAGIATEVFCAEPLVVGLRPSHRLASRDSVALAELAHEVLGTASEALFPAWALTQRQELETAGIAPPAVELADTDLAAIRWADQSDIDWILLIPSLAAAHTHTVIRPVAPRQLVPFTLQWNPSRAHTMAVARFVHCALAADLPPGWHTQPDHLRHVPSTRLAALPGDCSAEPNNAFASCLFFGRGADVRLAASTSSTPRTERTPPAMRSKPMILVALLFAAFLVNLDTTLVNVALPAMVRQLHATTTQLQWVVDAFNLVFAALLLTFGSLSDRFGRKGMLLAGLTVFGAASLVGGFTDSPAQLIAARSVMGLGAAMTFPATLSLISNVFTERKERARAIGLWGAIAGVAIAMGPIVGGWLLEHYSWASIFTAMAPVAAAAAILAALVVPTSKDPDAGPVDIAGLVLSSAAMAALVFTIIEAPTYGWTAARSLAGFAAAVVLLAAFIVCERRAAHPMLDVRLFRNMRFSAASGAVTVSFFTLFGFIFLATLYFQFVRGYSPLSTGVRLLPVALSVGAGSVAGTQLAVRFGTKLIVTTGLVAMAAFYAWVAATASATIGFGIIAAQMVVYGLGMGLTSAPATESIMGAISRTKAGVGSAVNDSTRLIGGTLGVAVIGSVYASVYGSHLTATMPASIPGHVAAIAHQSIGAAYTAAGTITALGHPALGQGLHLAATNAFLRGLTVGCLVAGGVAAAGALLAVRFLPAQPARPPAPAADEAGTGDGTRDAEPAPAAR